MSWVMSLKDCSSLIDGHDAKVKVAKVSNKVFTYPSLGCLVSAKGDEFFFPINVTFGHDCKIRNAWFWSRVAKDSVLNNQTFYCTRWHLVNKSCPKKGSSCELHCCPWAKISRFAATKTGCYPKAPFGCFMTRITHLFLHLLGCFEPKCLGPKPVIFPISFGVQGMLPQRWVSCWLTCSIETFKGMNLTVVWSIFLAKDDWIQSSMGVSVGSPYN